MQGKSSAFYDLDIHLFFLQEKSCLYVFKSQADIERHMAIIHGAEGHLLNPFGYLCKFEVDGKICGQVFKTPYYLGKHKKQENHQCNKKIGI